jgi:hypothetical protein
MTGQPLTSEGFWGAVLRLDESLPPLRRAMRSYAEQKVREKRKQLDRLENQLYELHRQADLLTAEVAAYEDVLAHEGGEATPSKHQVKAAKAGPGGGHWVNIISKFTRIERFTTDDVMRELSAIGQPNKRKSVRARLAVLVNEGTLKRVSDGVFAVAPRGVSGDELRAAGIIPPHARVIGEDP